MFKNKSNLYCKSMFGWVIFITLKKMLYLKIRAVWILYIYIYIYKLMVKVRLNNPYNTWNLSELLFSSLEYVSSIYKIATIYWHMI